MGGDPHDPRMLRLVFPATEMAVRTALRRLTSAAPLCELPQDIIDSAEIVIVEALNNIVEHAYANEVGEIELRIDTDDSNILVEIIDQGVALPGLALPEARLPDHAELPEGGFGWFLIHELTNGLAYRREGSRNILDLSLPIRPEA